ncbi:hypothetical protein [Streptomyces sp. N35]|uniref:hypothetical protein n=1 Tax=Streptomyces sp. N35 TaxID=2795730 RepID=UPI0018F570BC|nr:hypothetical protein [Streptomyces sp. N35]
MRTVLGACDVVAVGPRRREDWGQDVAAVMAREVEDPRRWPGVDRWPPAARPSGARPTYPFLPYRADELRLYLHPVEPDPAAWRLVSLLDVWFEAGRIPDIEVRKDELLGEARCVLERFGSDAAFYTNFDDHYVGVDRNPMSPQGSIDCLGELDIDCGLVAVSDDEVGVFWSFTEL